MTDSVSAYFRYWGKADKNTGKYHLLLSIIAWMWRRLSRNGGHERPTIRRSFCTSGRDMAEDQIRAWVLFFAALHDYGKFDIRFQLRSKPAWKLLYPAVESSETFPSEYECKHYYHGEGGLFWSCRTILPYRSLNPVIVMMA